MRKGGGSSKGSDFERQICKQLSLWWTHDERDDVFWRTAGSGARATNRAKQGKETSGAYGDLTAIDPIGSPLLAVCCFELKRGYGHWCMLDLIDKKPSEKGTTIAGFWRQACQSAEAARVPFAIVIFKRDQRLPCIMASRRLLNCLSGFVGPHRGNKILTEIDGEPVFVMPLSDWLDYVTPEAIRGLWLAD